MANEPHRSFFFVPQAAAKTTRSGKAVGLSVVRSHVAKVVNQRERRQTPRDKRLADTRLLGQEARLQVENRRKACISRKPTCDEGLPKCSKCLHTNLVCNRAALIRPVALQICSNPTETRSRNFFQERTVSILTSFADLSFWNHTVLQGGIYNEAIGRMIAAIGSFHEGVAQSDREERRRLHEFALEQYTMSVSLTICYGATIDLGQLLMLILLYVFFEGLQGHEVACWQHLASAVKIRSENSEADSVLLRSCVGPILDRIHGAARLLVLPAWWKTFHPQENLPPETDPMAGVTSVKDANERLETFTAPVLRLSSQTDVSRRQVEVGTSSDLLIRLEKWLNSVNTYVAQSGVDPCRCGQSHKDLAISYLQTQYLFTKIRILSVVNENRPYINYDSFQRHSSEFRQIVDLGQNIMELPNPSSATRQDLFDCLGFEISLSPVLNFILMSSKDASLKDEIIHLLHAWSSWHGGADQMARDPDVGLMSDVFRIRFGLNCSADNINGWAA